MAVLCLARIGSMNYGFNFMNHHAIYGCIQIVVALLYGKAISFVPYWLEAIGNN